MTKELLLLLSCVFAAMLGYGITLPVLPFHIDRLAASGGQSSEVAVFHVGAITGVFALAQVISAPLWGRLSDRTGRRLPLLLGLAGNAASLAAFGLASDLPVLYAARVLGGAFSGAILPAATAHITDLTDQRTRGRSLAWVGSAGSLGVVIGPAIGAFLATPETLPTFWPAILKQQGFAAPFLAAAAIVALTCSAAARWLPASSTGARSSDVAVVEESPRGRRVGLGWLLPYAFLAQFGLAVFEGTFALHASAERGLGPRAMGLVFATCGLVMAVTQGTVIAWLFARVAESVLVGTGLAVMALGLVLLMLSRDLAPIVAFVGVFALGTALVTPALASLVSQVTPTRAGAALGWQNASGSLGQAVGPPAGATLLLWTVHAPYLLAAVLLASAAIVWMFQWRGSPAFHDSATRPS